MPRNNLKEFRLNIANETQEEMALKWGISTSFYKQIEGGYKSPSIQKLKDFQKKYPEAKVDVLFLQ